MKEGQRTAFKEDKSEKISLKTVMRSVAALLAVFVLAGYAGMNYYFDQMRFESEKMRHSVSSVRLAEQLRGALIEYDRAGVLFSLTGSDAYLTSQGKTKENVLALLQQAGETERGTPAFGVYREVKRNVLNYFEQRRQWQDRDLSPEEYVNLSSARLTEIISLVGKLTRMNVEAANAARRKITDWEKEAGGFFAALSCVFVFSTGSIILLTNYFFFKPIRQFQNYIMNFINDTPRALAPQKTAETEIIGRHLKALTSHAREEEMRRMRDVAGIAHDLRSPTTAILNYVEMLGMHCEEKGDQECRSFASKAAEQVERLNNYIDQILDASKVRAGSFELTPSECDLEALIEKTLQQWREIEPQRVFKKKIEDGPQVRKLVCDAKRMEQVVNNLLSNAVKYSDKRDPIIVATKASGEWAEISVRDYGIGIGPEEIREIFRPFKRSKMAKEKARGTGLGLNNVKRIVEAHKGKVLVESELGKGSVFRVLLPLNAARSAEGSFDKKRKRTLPAGAREALP